jgi:hypothetical protein
MDWMNQLGGLLQQYAGKQDNDPYDHAEQDFDQVSQQAPRDVMSQGLAEAFRSNATPPFPNMLGQLFGQSNPTERASILNTLIGAAGPALLAGAMSRGSGIGSMLGPLGGMLSAGQQHVTPDVAAQVPPQAVEQLADQAQQQDPSVIDRVSDFYAEHPTLVKTLGAAALGIAMRHLANQKRGGLF